VNASHSMRKAGGYDHLVQQYRKENSDAREAQLRRWKSDPAFATGSTAAPVSAGESMAASSAGFSDVPRKPPPGTKLETMQSSPLEPTQTEPAAAPASNEAEGASPEPAAPEPSVTSEQPMAPTSKEVEQDSLPVPSDEGEVEGSPELQSDAIAEEMPTESEGREKEEDKPAIISGEAESPEEEEDKAAIISGEAESMDYTADSPAPVEGLSSAPEMPSSPEMSAAPEIVEEAPPEPVPVGLSGVTESETKQHSDGSRPTSGSYKMDEFEDSKDLDNTEGADGNTASAKQDVADDTYDNEAGFEEESSGDKEAFEQSKADLGESQGQPSSPEGKSGTLGATHTDEDYDEDFAEDSGAGEPSDG